MNESYGRDLDLNLLRAFAVVAETGSVTQAASRLYLTQPAISAALRRLTTAVGGALFVRRGRGIALTSRGDRLLREVRVHLAPLVDAALAPAKFDPLTSERTLRLGVADSSESWLLPALLRTLEQAAPRIRLIVLPVQFRTVGEALTSRSVDVAVTVADELPAAIRRERLFWGTFVALFDPRHADIGKKLRRADYFAREHVIVSYNGDLRGIVEDVLQTNRRVRCSVAGFGQIGAILDGTAMLATVPAIVAHDIRTVRPHLRTAKLPFALRGAPMEMLWHSAVEDDEACRFVRKRIARIAEKAAVHASDERLQKKLG